MNILLYGAGEPTDRHSETICRAAARLLGRRYPGAGVYLASGGFDTGLPGLTGYETHRRKVPAFSRGWMSFLFEKYVRRDDFRMETVLQQPVIKLGGGMDLCVSLGGSAYASVPPMLLYAADRGLFALRRRLELWDASFVPENHGERMRRDLNRFGRILAAESESFCALRQSGLSTAEFLPGLSYAMEPQSVPLPAGFLRGGVVGLCVGDGDVQKYAAFSRRILRSTFFSVLLAPYRGAPDGGDIRALDELRAALLREADDARRVLSPVRPLNAPETHYLFSKLRVLVTTQPDAAAAAMSGDVPVLLCCRNARARGLFRDALAPEPALDPLFSPEASADELMRGLVRLLSNETEVRALLRKNIAEMRRRLFEEFSPPAADAQGSRPD